MAEDENITLKTPKIAKNISLNARNIIFVEKHLKDVSIFLQLGSGVTRNDDNCGNKQFLRKT